MPKPIKFLPKNFLLISSLQILIGFPIELRQFNRFWHNLVVFGTGLSIEVSPAKKSPELEKVQVICIFSLKFWGDSRAVLTPFEHSLELQKLAQSELYIFFERKHLKTGGKLINPRVLNI